MKAEITRAATFLHRAETRTARQSPNCLRLVFVFAVGARCRHTPAQPFTPLGAVHVTVPFLAWFWRGGSPHLRSHNWLNQRNEAGEGCLAVLTLGAS